MIEDLIRATQSAAGGRSLSQLLQGFGQGITNYKNRVRGANVPIQQRPVINPEFLRPDFSGAGERARRFQEYQTGRNIPGASTDYSVRLGGGSNSAADRAYQQEFSRVAQLTAQDPELQRYEAARKLAVAPGATPEQVQSAEDIGMQIWAQKYGKTLAPKVKPGQSGYDTIQGVLNAGAMGTPMDLPFDTKNVLGGKPMPEGLSYGTTAPTAIPGGTPIKGGGFPEGQAAMFQRFMQGPATTAPTFQGSPLGTTPQLNALNYGGAVQPLGTAVSDDFYKTEKAKELAAMFANYRIGQ
jgi:hypothetical protein